MSEDAIAEFKEGQRQGWKHFAPLEALTTPAAARLVKFASVRAGQNVLDVGCGTGVPAKRGLHKLLDQSDSLGRYSSEAVCGSNQDEGSVPEG